jgi:hypothetical protein
LKLGGEMTSADASKVGLDSAVLASNCLLDYGIVQGRQGYDLIGSRPGYSASDTAWGLGYGKYSADDVQRLVLTGTTGGTFTLSYYPVYMAGCTWNAAAKTLTAPAGSVWQRAPQATETVHLAGGTGSPGNYTVASSTVNTITFTTAGFSGSNQAAVTAYEIFTTAAIAWNATSTAIAQAFSALVGVGTGDLQVSGNNLPQGPMLFRWTGQYANVAMQPMVANVGSLSGSSPAAAISHMIVGGNYEKFLVFIQAAGSTSCSLYSVDLLNGNAWTLETTGTIPTSDWYCEQYAGVVYCVNGQAGMHTYTLGGGALAWDGGQTSLVVAPAFPETANQQSNLFTTPPVIGSVSGYSGWGVNPTPSISGAGISFTINAAISSPTTVTFVANLNVTTNLAFRDVVLLWGSTSATRTKVDASFGTLVETNTTPATITPLPGVLQILNAGTAWSKWFDFGDGIAANRVLRKTVASYTVTLKIAAASIGDIVYVNINPYDSWPGNSALSPNTGLFAGPDGSAFMIPAYTAQYAYTYGRTSDGAESQLSPIATVAVPSMGVQGYYFQVICPTSTQAGIDTVYLYRLDAMGIWRRIQNADCSTWGLANTGASVTFTDAWMESEIEVFPAFNSSLLGSWISQGFASPNGVQLGVWKGSLCVGTQRLLLMSWVNNPTRFAPSPENRPAIQALDVNDPSQGVSEYVSDNRAGDALAVFGLDTLYVVTADSVYAVVGDLPLTSSPTRRLPGSRGGLGPRAVCTYSAGVLVGTPDGLWHYAVSRAFSGVDDGSAAQAEVSREERGAWASLVGSAAPGLVVTEHLDEVWAVNGRRFLFLSRNKIWCSGTLAHAMKAALPIRTRGLYWIDSTGRLMMFSYSTSADAGNPVTWTYQTGIEVGMRAQVRGALISCDGTPTVAARGWDGANGVFDNPPLPVDPMAQWFLDLHLQPGFRLQLTFSGLSGTDTIEQAVLDVETEVGRGK